MLITIESVFVRNTSSMNALFVVSLFDSLGENQCLYHFQGTSLQFFYTRKRERVRAKVAPFFALHFLRNKSGTSQNLWPVKPVRSPVFVQYTALVLN